MLICEYNTGKRINSFKSYGCSLKEDLIKKKENPRLSF